VTSGLALVIVGIFIAALCILGQAYLALARSTWDWADLLSFGFPLGAGLVTWTLFLLSMAGLPVTAWTTIAVYLVLLTAAAAALLMRRIVPRSDAGMVHTGASGSGNDRVVNKALLGGMALVTVTAAALSIARSYSTWDAAAIWAVKGYGVYLEGTVRAAERWGAHGAAYPLNVPLLIGSIFSLTGDPGPVSKVLFPGFLMSISLVSYRGWRALGVSQTLAGLGALTLATTPVLFYHGTIGYANLPLAAYILGGSIMGVIAIHGTTLNARLAVLSGVFLGLASWTRVDGLLYGSAVVGSLILVAAILQGRHANWNHIVLLAAAFGVITLIWVLYYESFGAQGSQATGAYSRALAAWRQGDYRLQNIRLIFGYFRRNVFHLPTWGVLFAAVGALLLLNWRVSLQERDPVVLSLLLAFGGTALVTCVLFYVGSYVKVDYLPWLEQGFPRAFFPSVTLLVAGALGSCRGVSTGTPAPAPVGELGDER